MSTVLDHDALRELLGAYAADAVDDPEERDAVERHLESCGVCRAELTEHLEALASLSDDEPVGSSDTMWRAVHARIAPAEEQPLAKVIPLRRRLRGPLVVAGSVAAAVLLTVWITSSRGGDGQPERTAAIVPAEDGGTVNGTVEVFAPDTPNGRVQISLRDVPDAPSDHHYEVWVLRPGEGEEMEAIGAFAPVDGRADLDLPLPGAGEYVALDISVQENGGSPEHSGTSLAGAKLA